MAKGLTLIEQKEKEKNTRKIIVPKMSDLEFDELKKQWDRKGGFIEYLPPKPKFKIIN